MAADQPISDGTAPQLSARGASKRRRSDERVAAMYAEYQGGKSLDEVGRLFGCTRQSVYAVFTTRKLALRSKVFQPVVQFNGRSYTERHDGYWRATEGNRSQLHRDTWIFFNGPIPDGWDVHHVDGNPSNNAIGNLECLPKKEHGKVHSPRLPVPDKCCLRCGRKLVRRESSTGIIEGPTALGKRKFCNTTCMGRFMRGRSPGSVCS